MRTTSIRLSLALGACLSLGASLFFVQGCASPDVDSESEEVTGESQQAITTLIPAVSQKICSIMGTSANGEYEASGVQLKDGYLYVVFDSKNRVAKIPVALGSGTGTYTTGTLSSTNQYEGITYDSNNTTHFYVMQEVYPPVIVQLDGTGSASSAVYQTVSMSSFGESNHWFEGVAWLRRNNNDYLLSLCQTGNCDTAANGEFKAGTMRVLAQSGSSWSWTNSQTVQLCTSAGCPNGPFKNYSDVALWSYPDGSAKVAIVSRDSKQLWVGTLSASSWTLSAGTIYNLPSNYNWVEGVTFLNEVQLAMVSDSNGVTTGSCADGTTDESVHYFNLP